MKKVLNTILAGAGVFALVSILAPANASAQICHTGSYYGSHGGYGYGGYHAPVRRYHAPVRRYHAPRAAVRVYVAPSRVITRAHYGGPIYHRKSVRHHHYATPRSHYRSDYGYGRRYRH